MCVCLSVSLCAYIIYTLLLYRFMKTPEKLSALRNARLTLRKRDRKIAHIKKQLESLTLERGVAVESEVQVEIQGVIDRENSEMESLPRSDFRRIFWEQQVHCVHTNTHTPTHT